MPALQRGGQADVVLEAQVAPVPEESDFHGVNGRTVEWLNG
jgi:hypothetical protein